MTNPILTDVDWLNFNVTIADLDRLEKWMNKPEQFRGVSLDEITRRIIKGRLEHGSDDTVSALPVDVIPQGVLSWRDEEKWEVSTKVLVARGNSKDGYRALFGVVKGLVQDWYDIQTEEGLISYKRCKNHEEASRREDHIRESIAKQEENQSKTITREERLSQGVEIVLLKYGADIFSKVDAALHNNNRFVSHHNYWYLLDWVKTISQEKILKIQHRLWRQKKVVPNQVRELLPEIPQDEIGDLSIDIALKGAPDKFIQNGDSWQIIQPPPPPLEKAVAVFYVYDPQTYQIILKPGDRLTKPMARKLQQLGYYDSVVDWAVD